MLFADAQKFALNAAKEIVIAHIGDPSATSDDSDAQKTADFYEAVYRKKARQAVYRRVLSLAVEVKP